MVRIVDFADGFSSATNPDIGSPNLEEYTLTNNQATFANIAGLLFDEAEELSVFMDYELERVGSSTYRQAGSMQAIYNGSWSLIFGNFSGDELIQDVITNQQEVIFSLSGGQMQYKTGNQPGHTQSKLKLNIVRITV